jgi:hypothetical protein
MAKIKCLKSQYQVQCKKREFVFENFDDRDTKDKIVIQKYHSVRWFVVTHACQLIYSGGKDW